MSTWQNVSHSKLHWDFGKGPGQRNINSNIDEKKKKSQKKNVKMIQYIQVFVRNYIWKNVAYQRKKNKTFQ